MAKDDYFVLVYRILKYLYGCFKDGERPVKEMFGAEALGINNRYWVNIMESLSEEGYIRGVTVKVYRGGMKNLMMGDVRITEKGIEFLEDNSKMKQAVEFLKTAKDIIPGF